MPTLVDAVLEAVRARRPGGPVCLVCSRRISPRDRQFRLRGGTAVHRDCATYDMRRRRTGADRLGYPRR